MPTFSETITNYNNAVAAKAAQQVIIDTSIEELIGHAQNAQDNGAGGNAIGFLQIGDNFITRDGLTFKVTVVNDPDTATYPEGRVIGVEVNPESAPSFNL